MAIRDNQEEGAAMAAILIIYYSRSGHTKAMADLVALGAREAGADVDLKSVADATPDDMLAADGIIMGTPTYYGGPAAELKKLLDESVNIHGKLAGKVGGAFASAANIGGGNETAILDLLHAMLIHGMIVPGIAKGDHYGPVAINQPDDRAEKQCRRLGGVIAGLVERLAQ